MTVDKTFELIFIPLLTWCMSITSEFVPLWALFEEVLGSIRL